eukprot:COSAG05_NODE_18140_length_313_cov_0.724299_1_plen_32_part_10
MAVLTIEELCLYSMVHVMFTRTIGNWCCPRII